METTFIYSMEFTMQPTRLFSTYEGMIEYIKDHFPIGSIDIRANVHVLKIDNHYEEYDQLPLIWRVKFRVNSKGEVIETSRL